MLSPAAIDDSGFTVEADPEVDGGFVVRGRKPERWVRQTQFDNDEAVGYLADRLARLGVEDELARLGAEPGASVTIGDYVFDFAAHRRAGREDYQPTRRGTDERLAPAGPARRRRAAGREAGPPGAPQRRGAGRRRAADAAAR